MLEEFDSKPKIINFLKLYKGGKGNKVIKKKGVQPIRLDIYSKYLKIETTPI